jgi:hypothetical protein
MKRPAGARPEVLIGGEPLSAIHEKHRIFDVLWPDGKSFVECVLRMDDYAGQRPVLMATVRDKRTWILSGHHMLRRSFGSSTAEAETRRLERIATLEAERKKKNQELEDIATELAALTVTTTT